MKLSFAKSLALFSFAFLLAPGVAQATPYASSITNTGSAISFRLNESADSVKIISDSGATTNDLGARAAGLHTVAVSVAGTFFIEVNKAPSLGYLNGVTNLITADTNVLLRFNAPRGVAVNRNPASPYFGRIYVSNADTGSLAASGAFPARNLVNGDGIFVLNADFTDALGQGNTARTAGIDWRSTLSDQANKPFRVEVGEDNNLYISDYTFPTNVPATGNLYVADPDVTPAGTNVFAFDPNNTGRFPSSAIVKGSLGGGNLTVYGIYPDKFYEFDFFGTPSISYSVMQRWDVASGPLPSAVAPVRVTDLPILIADVPSVLSDIDIAPDGKYFIAQNRSSGFEAGLFVVDPAKDVDGSGFPDIVYDSFFFSVTSFGVTNDLLFQTRAVKVSPDNRVVALIRDDNRVWIIPLTNGLPDLAGRMLMDSGVTTTLGRDIGFDAAGNLYTASSGQGAVKSFSPGFPSRAVTGSDGTFSITRVTGNDITLTLVDTNLSEPGANTAQFTLTRAGDVTGPLNVRLTYTGTATYTNDYTGAPTNITFAAGQSVTNIVVTALDDSLGEALETIIVSIAPGTNYLAKGAFSGTLFLADDGDLPSVTISGADTNLYERMAVDTGRFLVTRAGAPTGNLNVNLAFTGTATNGTDYVTVTNVVTISNNLFSVTNFVTAIDNSLLDGNRTIIISIAPGAGYVIGAASSTTLLLRDDETTPNTPVLFSEDFDVDHSANYTVRFGADNGVDDKLVDFNFDYSTAGIPIAPHTTNGTTRGLKLTVNKDATASAAGVNVYANGVSFSNEYVLRFDMYTTFTNVPAGTTEHDIFGINHSGNVTNRAVSAGGLVGGDGVWAAVEADGSASSTARSYAIFGSTNSTVAPPFSSASARAFDTFFTIPPFAFAGYPTAGAPSRQWVDVELSQTNLNGSLIVTLKINGVTMVSRTNNTAFTSGTIMLGYMDSFASVGSPNNFVVYDNVRVVNLTADRPVITAVRKNGANVEVDFTAGAADLPTAFTLESTTTLPGGFTTDAGSSVLSLGPGSFRAVSPNSADAQRFYQIRR
jgi:hypothetical protein